MRSGAGGVSTRQDASARARTCERERDVVIERDDLADRARVLELQDGLLLDAEHDDVVAPHADLFVRS